MLITFFVRWVAALSSMIIVLFEVHLYFNLINFHKSFRKSLKLFWINAWVTYMRKMPSVGADSCNYRDWVVKINWFSSESFIFKLHECWVRVWRPIEHSSILIKVSWFDMSSQNLLINIALCNSTRFQLILVGFQVNLFIAKIQIMF